MSNYSGRTTTLDHKFDGWEEKGKDIGTDCIQEKILFDVQWSNCPVEVEVEVRRLWRDYQYCNDNCYHEWDSEYKDGKQVDEYPIIAEYLESRGIKKCLIHWWW